MPELESLKLLRKAVAMPFAKARATQVLPHDWEKAGLLAMDIMAGHGMRDAAAAMLRRWYDNCGTSCNETGDTLGSISVTKLLTDGILPRELGENRNGYSTCALLLALPK